MFLLYTCEHYSKLIYLLMYKTIFIFITGYWYELVRFFAIPAKLAVTGPFLRAVSYGILLIPSYRKNASDFSFVIFAIADRIFLTPRSRGCCWNWAWY